MPCQTSSRIWFHFYVNALEGQKLTLTIRNLNARGRMYREGFKPFFKNGENGAWNSIPSEIIFGKSSTLKGCWEISWTHTFENDMVYFAFCYPFSYNENQRYLDVVERRALAMQEFYFHRDNMIYTADGNRCDLLTISSFKHVSSECEPTLSDMFPDQEPRARQFDTNKQVVFVTARVHPGETPAAHICNGIIDFLTGNDPRAQLLRDAFVFKVVPMINPDGVKRGHFRSDNFGVNLNRKYQDPNIETQQTVFAIRKLAEYYA